MSGSLLLLSAQAPADETTGLLGPGYWRVAVAPLTLHYRYSEEHRHVFAVALERQHEDTWLAGIAPFRNSFGQASVYLYAGKQYRALWGVPELTGQVSGGLLYGYRGKYKNKVPLNFNGFSPGALAGLGWKVNRDFAVTAHLLGDAGVMFQLSLDLR